MARVDPDGRDGFRDDEDRQLKTQNSRRLYLFDIDGTLLNSGGAGSAAMRAAFERVYGIEDGFASVEFSGRSDLAIIMDALAAIGVSGGAVSQDMEGKEKVDAFFAQRSFDRLEPYIDPKLSLMMELKVDTLPTTILYDAEGREVWRMTGMEDWEGKRAAGLLQEATEG